MYNTFVSAMLNIEFGKKSLYLGSFHFTVTNVLSYMFCFEHSNTSTLHSIVWIIVLCLDSVAKYELPIPNVNR